MKAADPYTRARRLTLALAVCGVVWQGTARADLIDEDDEAPVQTVPPAPQPGPTPAPATPAPHPRPNAQPATPQPAPQPAPSPGKTPTPPQNALPPKSHTTGKRANAASEDSKQPVQFTSDGMEALKEAGTVLLKDNVVVTQGTMRMKAKRARIFYDTLKKDVIRVIAEGDVEFNKIDEDSGDKIRALGDRAEFERATRTVVLDGNARLWRGADLVKSKKITYEMDSGFIRFDRVAGEVHPSSTEKPPK